MTSSAHIITPDTSDAFFSAATEFIADAIRSAQSDRGLCILGLSGGSTPRPIYEALGREEDIDWTTLWLFLVDDRYVPRDNPNSNQFLLDSTILKHAPIPDSHVIVPDTTLPLQECIRLYERHLADLLKKGPPDLITLGMGDDGHIASLFPPVADEGFGPQFVINTQTEKFTVKERISVTMPVLTRAREAMFLFKGVEKKKTWEEMMASDEDAYRWPAKALIEAVPTTIIGQW